MKMKINKNPNPAYETTDNNLFITHGDRKYLLKGIDNTNGQKLKATIKAINNTRFHIDSIDLYISKQRKTYAKETALLFNTEPEITEQDLNKIIETTEDYIKNRKNQTKKQPAMTEEEKTQALKLLKSPNLINQILKDFETIGCAGEETNKIIGYLASISRKLNDPLSILILSRSAAGKSFLQDAILELIPEEDKSKYTRITGQALFYKGEHSLKHKVIAIEEEEGANQAAYSIRTMQSSKYLTIASTATDPATGQMKTFEYKVQGPLVIILTTTRTNIDYETLNRFIVLSIDESAQQTKLIHNIQRNKYTLEGLLTTSSQESIIKKHHNAQRLLRPIKVVNPYVKKLTFTDDRLRTRRDHKKYLNLIEVITFLHQYQRKIKSIQQSTKRIEYIETTLDDIRFANILAKEILTKTIDELSQPARKLLSIIKQMITKQAKKDNKNLQGIQFTRRTLREYAKWSDYQIRIHLKELVDLEYITAVCGRNGSRYLYQLSNETTYDDNLLLADTKTLRTS